MCPNTSKLSEPLSNVDHDYLAEPTKDINQKSQDLLDARHMRHPDTLKSNKYEEEYKLGYRHIQRKA